MKKTIFIVAFYLLSSCGSEYDKRSIVRTLSIGNGNIIEVYRYSYISSFSPYYVELKNQSSHRQLIFLHPGICDIKFENATLFIKADKSSKSQFCDSSLIKIKIDSSHTCFIQDEL